MAPVRKRPEHALAVDYPSANAITDLRFSMLQDWWDLFDTDQANQMRAMIDEAMEFRAVLEEDLDLHQETTIADPGEHDERVAQQMMAVLLNESWFVEIVGKNAEGSALPQKTVKKIRGWQEKRQETLVPLMDAFTYQVGNPAAAPSVFEAHGYTPFLAARIRFLAAFERVYNNDLPLQSSDRKLSEKEKWFEQYDKLHRRHVQKMKENQQEGSVESGDHRDGTYFTFPLLDETWEHYHPDRNYNWNIPRASLDLSVEHAHSLMVSHGITLVSSILVYGAKPIDLSSPKIALIEKTLHLCIKAIELYWQLTRDFRDEDGKYGPELRKTERKRQKQLLTENVRICQLVERDLQRARSLEEAMPKSEPMTMTTTTTTTKTPELVMQQSALSEAKFEVMQDGAEDGIQSMNMDMDGLSVSNTQQSQLAYNPTSAPILPTAILQFLAANPPPHPNVARTSSPAPLPQASASTCTTAVTEGQGEGKGGKDVDVEMGGV